MPIARLDFPPAALDDGLVDGGRALRRVGPFVEQQEPPLCLLRPRAPRWRHRECGPARRSGRVGSDLPHGRRRVEGILEIDAWAHYAQPRWRNRSPMWTSSIRPRTWPALDGVRAIAVLAVFTFHATYPTFLKGGYVGVDMFFVLSGFLITWLLTSEREQLGSISYGKFYARRALRLFPALYALIIVAAILVELDGGLAGARHTTLIGIPFVILYVGNWSSAFGAYNAVTLGLLAITWTLAIEEQYYLLWPLALSRLLKRMHHRRIAVILVAVALAEEVLRSGLDLLNKPQLYNWLDRSTLTHSDGLLIGSALALMYTCRGQWKAWPAIRRRADALSVAGALVLAVAIVAGKPTLHSTGLWETVAVYGSVALLAGLIAQPTSWPSRVLEWWPLQWIGKRSYGIYLWHFTVIVVVLTLNLPQRHLDLYRFVIELVATLVVAGLSFTFIERPAPSG